MKRLIRCLVASCGLSTAAMLCLCALPALNGIRPIGDAVPYLLLALAALKTLDIVDSWLYEWEPKE